MPVGPASQHGVHWVGCSAGVRAYLLPPAPIRPPPSEFAVYRLRWPVLRSGLRMMTPCSDALHSLTPRRRRSAVIRALSSGHPEGCALKYKGLVTVGLGSNLRAWPEIAGSGGMHLTSGHLMARLRRSSARRLMIVGAVAAIAASLFVRWLPAGDAASIELIGIAHQEARGGFVAGVET